MNKLFGKKSTFLLSIVISGVFVFASSTYCFGVDDQIDIEKQLVKPRTARYWLKKGIAHFESGRYKNAVEDFKKAIEKNPGYAQAYNNLGITYYKLGMHQEAVEAYQHAITLNPDYAKAFNNLGLAYYGMDKYQEAVKAYQQAVSLNPEYAKAHLNLGETYIAMGNTESAFDEYRILSSLDADLANDLMNVLLDSFSFEGRLLPTWYYPYPYRTYAKQLGFYMPPAPPNPLWWNYPPVSFYSSDAPWTGYSTILRPGPYDPWSLYYYPYTPYLPLSEQ